MWNIRRILRGGLLLGALAGLAACSSNTSRVGGVIADTNIKLSPGFGVPLEKIVFWGAYAGAAYLILDPLAPNWSVEVAPLSDNLVLVSMRMKRYHAGGAGEARQVFQRRARDLVQYGGFDSYDVVEYEEGLDSSVLGAQRVANGVICLQGPGHLQPEQPEQTEGGLTVDQNTAPPARITSDMATKPRS